MFSLYKNDLTDLLPKDNVLLYADDTVLFGTDANYVQSMLDCTYDWCGESLLTVNCKKSQWLKTNLVCKTLVNSQFQTGNILLDQVNEYKYLGLIMDPQLKFQSHRDNLHKRLNYKMTFFKKIWKYINIEVA